jgi:hypothetical protein
MILLLGAKAGLDKGILKSWWYRHVLLSLLKEAIDGAKVHV